MKQFSAANITDLRTRNIDIYATVVIAVLIGLATLTPVEELPAVSGSDHHFNKRCFTHHFLR